MKRLFGNKGYTGKKQRTAAFENSVFDRFYVWPAVLNYTIRRIDLAMIKLIEMCSSMVQQYKSATQPGLIAAILIGS